MKLRLVPLVTAVGCACTPPHLVATDIDETLTTSNEEWGAQIGDATYDPAMRPDANTLMQGYADLGYTVIYVTGRWSGQDMTDGETSTEITAAWLQNHDFPFAAEDLYLADEDHEYGDVLSSYKADVLDSRIADGWTADWAYGNADTDIAAFEEAGIANDHIFLVGALAGTLDVEGITDDDAYTAHAAAQLPVVESVGCG